MLRSVSSDVAATTAARRIIVGRDVPCVMAVKGATATEFDIAEAAIRRVAGFAHLSVAEPIRDGAVETP